MGAEREPDTYLAVDVGNSRTKCGVFEGGNMRALWGWETCASDPDPRIRERLLQGWSEHGPEGSGPCAFVVASVVEGVGGALIRAASEIWDCRTLEVTSDTAPGLRVDLPNPSAVGVDRLLASAAAYRLFGGPIIVAALGTVWAISAVAGDGRFVGGALFPGLETATWAMHARTSRLPRVSPEQPPELPGRDTEGAILSGVVLAAAGGLDRISAELTTSLGTGTQLVLTGGEAELVSPHLASHHRIEPDLVLKGLAGAYLALVDPPAGAQ